MTSEPFRIGRRELALLAAGEYLRKFWFVALPVPLGGVLGLIFLPNVAPVWFAAILWPISLPARAILASRRSARLFVDGCRVSLDDEAATFVAEPGPEGRPRLRYRLPWTRIRAVRERGEWIVLEGRRFEVLPVRRSALPEGALAEGPLSPVVSADR